MSRAARIGIFLAVVVLMLVVTVCNYSQPQP